MHGWEDPSSDSQPCEAYITTCELLTLLGLVWTQYDPGSFGRNLACMGRILCLCCERLENVFDDYYGVDRHVVLLI